MKKLLLLMILIFGINIFAENLVTGTKIIGDFKNYERVNDGEISNTDISAEMTSEHKRDYMLIIDFKKSVLISNLHVFWFSDYVPTEYKIEKSNDILNWEPVTEVKTSEQKDEGFVKLTYHKIEFEHITTRFLRILIPKDVKNMKNTDTFKIVELVSKLEIKDIPMYSDFHIRKLRDTSVYITWQTVFPIETTLGYSLDTYSFKTYRIDNVFTKKHIMKLSNLLSGTRYYYFIMYKDVSGLLLKSTIQSVKTTGPTMPRLLKNSIIRSHHSAVIKPYFNTSVNIKFKIGTTPHYGFAEITSIGYKKNHTIKISNLLEDIEYHFGFEYETKDGLNDTSKNYTFKTTPMNIALNKPVEGTFNYNKKTGLIDTSLINRVNDGAFTSLGHMAVSQDFSVEDQWLIIDLEKTLKIKTIRVFWRRIAMSLNYSLYGSIDKQNWELIEDNISAENGAKTFGEHGGRLRVNNIGLPPRGKKIRYIKLIHKKDANAIMKYRGNKHLELSEIIVYKKNPRQGVIQLEIE